MNQWLQTLQIEHLAEMAHRHVQIIAYAMATSLVVTLSSPINGLISKMAGNWHFLLRTLFYVVVFTAGYASLAFWSERILRQFLSDQKPLPLLVLSVLAFLGFGIWAGQKKHMK